MLLRVFSKNGALNIKVNENSTVGDLKQAIFQETQILPSEQKLSFLSIPSFKNVSLSNDSSILKEKGISQGNQIILSTTKAQPEKMDLDKLSSSLPLKIEKINQKESYPTNIDIESGSSNNNNNNNNKKTAISPKNDVSNQIKESEIDLFIDKLDGWTERKSGSNCIHAPNSACSACLPLAPWSVLNAPEFEHMNLKHLTFRAWLREKEYNSPNMPMVLNDCKYCIDSSGDLSAHKNIFSLVLERQFYRHVDHVEFESPDIIDRYLSGWRDTGRQRCGFLFGKYVLDPNIPLGVRAVVMAIYEAPQLSKSDEVYLLKDTLGPKVDEMMNFLGLERIGFIWTSIKTDSNLNIVPDRDSKDYTLNGHELMRICRLQNQYCSYNKRSDSGIFGSRFVSVLVHGNDQGSIEIQAYQASNQLARLVRDGAVMPSNKGAGLFRVRHDSQSRIFPTILYSRKNEYGYNEQCKADRTFPTEFGIVSLNYSSPIDPKPSFKSNSFPIENRPHSSVQPSPSALLQHIQSNYPLCLEDFHLIIYLIQKSQEITEKVLMVLRGTIKDNEEINQLKSKIRDIFERDSPRAGNNRSGTTEKFTSSSNTRNSMDFNYNSPQSTSSLDPVKLAMVENIVSMGYTQNEAMQSLQCVDYNSVEEALNLLLT